MNRRWVTLGLGIACCGVLTLVYPAFLRWSELRAQVAETKCELAEGVARVAELNIFADRLRNDPALIEELAREQGFARPGDTVLKFPPRPRADSTTTRGCHS
jgi:hypothetical protein